MSKKSVHDIPTPYTKNPWHYVSPGKDVPNTVNAIIEIPAESQAKYELDK